MLTQDHVFVGKNLLSDHFARLAVDNIFRFLERAYRDGGDMEAREGLMLAALAAGCAFGTAGTAAAHALQYTVGNLTHPAHGDGVARAEERRVAEVCVSTRRTGVAPVN